MMQGYKIVNDLLYKGDGQVKYMKSPNQSGTMNPEALIYHDTASGLNASGPISWLRNRRAKASAHLVIARDGTVTQLVPFNRVAWHAGKSSHKIGKRRRKGLNRYSIGIEIVNPGGLKSTQSAGKYKAWTGQVYSASDYTIEKKRSIKHRGYNYWMSYTPEQIEACQEIGSLLEDHYKLKMIGTHWMISPGRKIDTNPLFPLDKIVANITGRKELTGTGIVEAIKGKFRGKVSRSSVGSISGLNLRKYPSPRSRILKTLTYGTKVTVIRKGNITGKKWWKITDGSNRGWVDSRYLKEGN